VDVGASRADRRLFAAASGCYTLRCWLRGIVNSRAVYTSGCITRCSEQEVSVLCYLVQTILKMSKVPTVYSYDNELFTTEIWQLPAIWDSGSSYYSNKQ
jgi:hypothetical protein